MLFNIIVFTTLIFSILFLIAGLSLMVFGKKQIPSEGTARVEIQIFESTISTPYQTSFILAIIGIVLMFMTHTFFKDTSDEYGAENTGLSLITKAYAHKDTTEAADGWVYFGYEKNPALWNFEFVNGSFNKMLKGESTTLRSIKTMNVREDHYGDFTGTVLSFFSPEPEITGRLDEGKCIKTIEVISVGFSKIWVKFIAVPCN